MSDRSYELITSRDNPKIRLFASMHDRRKASREGLVYIEGMNEYLKVHLISGDPLLVHTSFKQMNGHLPDNFLQIHRSYVINVNYIREVERSMVLLEGGKRISISDSNRDAFMAYLKARSISR